MWQEIDPVSFITDFADRIYHVDCKDIRVRVTGRNTRLGSHLPWGDPRRGWDFVSFGRGDVPWDAAFRALRSIGYEGPISIEGAAAGMVRLHGAQGALAVLRGLACPVSELPLDAAFSSQGGDARPRRPARRAGGAGPDLPHPRTGCADDPARLGCGGPPRAPGG